MAQTAKTTRGKVKEGKLATARALLLHRAPYYSSLLYALAYVEQDKIRRHPGDPGVDTFGVTRSRALLYTPGALAQWSEEEIAAVLEHELLHILFDDVAAIERLSLDPRIANIAMDIRINDQVRRGGAKLPETGCFPENPAWGSYTDEHGQEQPGVPPGLSMLEIYDLLLQTAREGKGGASGEGEGKGDGESVRGRAQALSDALASDPFGHCGSGAGNPLDGEPETPAGAERSEAEIEAARQEVAAAIVEHSKKSAGSQALGALLAWAQDRMRPSRVPWRSKLARALRRAVEYVRGQADHTYTRLSRRQGVVGYGPTSPILAGTRTPVPRVRVVIDTSGSMSGSDIEQAMGEIDGVLRAVRGVEVVCCDAEVHGRPRKVATWREAAASLRGGGGTRFQPVFDGLAAEPANSRPNVVIFVTDGYPCDRPTNPSGVRTIWVVTSGGPTGFAPFGDFVQVEA